MTTDYQTCIETDEVWVLAFAERIAGVLVLRIRADDMLIFSVAVDPARQGQGLGRRLLDHAEKRARCLDKLYVRLYTNAHMTENLALYQSYGYRETHREAWSGGSDRVFMEKSLA